MDWKTKITAKIQRRVPELVDNSLLLEDLLEEAFVSIMRYSNASAYNKEWDSLLVTCVVTLYNYMGMEGSTERRANGIVDFYETSSILTPILSRNITPCIKPLGYVFSEDRYKFPD
jgi:hypothetical protein